MILVDTSVWIAYFRGTNRQIVLHLQSLLEEDQVVLAVLVKLEILGGCSKRDLPHIRRSLSALPVFLPSEPTWQRIEGWVEAAVAEGERFGVADLLIAALAAERGLPIWSLDGDFSRMQRLGFVQLHIPPGS